MYMSGRVGNEPRGPAAIIDIAPLAPRATMPAPSSGSSARSAALAAGPDARSWRERSRASAGADDDVARRSGAGRAPPASRRTRPPAPLLVVAPEPAAARERRALRHACVALAEAGRAAWPLPGRARPRRRGPSDSLQPVRALHHELDHGGGRAFTILVLDHGHSLLCPLARRCSPAGSGCRRGARGTCRAAARRPSVDVPDPEMARMRVLALDREHALDDERVRDRRGSSRARGARPRAPVDQPSCERALDRGVHADEDVPRLVEEPVQERVDLLLLGAAQPFPASKLE